MKKALFLLGAALLAQPAFAQAGAQTATDGVASPETAATPDPSADDIVVTARRRAESLQDVPLTVNALSQAQIERQSISDLADVAARTPGLQFNDGLGQGDARIALRGQSNIRAASRPSVAILVDGIDVPFQGGLNTESLDIARIEVVKGPQSALFGRGVIAGAINYVTRRPEFETSGFVQGEVGTRELYDVRGRINLPLSDTVAVAASARYKFFDGFFRNRLSGRRTVGDEEVKAGVFSILLKPDDTFDAYARVSYSDEYLGQAQRHTVESNQQVGPLPANIWYVGRVRTDTNLIRHNADDYAGFTRKVLFTSLAMDKDLGGAVLSSLTAFNRTRRIADVDNDFQGSTSFDVPFSTVFQNNNRFDGRRTIKNLSQEFRLASPDGNRFSWLIGGFYLDQSIRAMETTIRGTIIQPGQQRRTPLAENTETRAIFGSLGYRFSEQFSVTGELRWNRDETDVNTENLVGAPFFRKNSWRAWLPRVTVEYKPSRDLLLYASAAKGNKPGGFNTAVGAGAISLPERFIPFEEENAWAYEVGIKSTLLDGMVTLNAAVFHVDSKNLQVDDQYIEVRNPAVPGGPVNPALPISLGGTAGYTSNAGKAKVTGFEVEVTVRPAQGLSIAAGYSYNPSRIYDYQDTRARAIGVSTLGKRQLPFSADHSANANIYYETPVTDRWTVFGEATGRYRSTQYGSVTEFEETGSRFVADLRAGIRSERIEFTAFVTNVFDNLRAESVAPFVNPQTTFRNFLVTVPNPRQGGVRARFNF